MRPTILPFAFAAMALSVSACASTPTRFANAADVPMYTPAEWTAMNTEQSVPEFPVDGVASNDATLSDNGFTGGFAGGFRGFRGMSHPNGFTGQTGFSGGSGRSTISFSGHAGSSAVGGHMSAGFSGGGMSMSSGHSSGVSGGHSGGHR